MTWAVYGGFVVAVATGAYFALKYAKKHRLGVYDNPAPKKVGRHAHTGEFGTVEHETPKGYADYTTAAIPKAIVVGPEISKAPVLESETTGIYPTPTGKVYLDNVRGADEALPTAFLPPVPMAKRTDTTMMEAVDPTKYPDWMNQ